MTEYKSLDQQIEDAQRRVALLKKRRTKQQNDQYMLIGKAFVRKFGDIDLVGSALDYYMELVYESFSGGKPSGEKTDQTYSEGENLGADLRLQDMLSE